MAPWEEYAKAKPAAAAAPAAEEGPWAQYAPKASTGPDYAGDVQRFRGKDQSARDQGSLGNTIAEFGAGAWHGAKAPIRGAQQLFNYVTGDTKRLEELQREEEEASNKLTGAGKAGNIFGQVATAFIPVAGQVGKGLQAANVGTKALSAASKASPLLKASATGAGVAALDPTMSKDGQAQDYLTEKAKDVAIGAGLGAAGQQVGRLFSGASDAVKQASKDLGGIATPGQLIAAKGGKWEKLGAAERKWGQYLPGSGITGSRDAAHEAGVRGMLAREAEKAGVDVSNAKNFKEMFEATQAGKKQGYQDVVPSLSFGKSNQDFSDAVSQSMKTHTQNLTGPVRAEVQSALRQAGISPHNVAGKTQVGPYQGQNVQDVLSTLNGQISKLFAHNATRADNAAGEALVKVRDDLLGMAEKASKPGDFERYKALNRLHQMTGSDVQTKKGVFGRAKSFVEAQERGMPTLQEINRAALNSGRQTVAKNEVAEEAARIASFAGKHSSHETEPLARLFTMLKGVPATAATGFTSVILPRIAYNPYSIKLINKLAQEGHPEAQKALVLMGRGSAGVERGENGNAN